MKLSSTVITALLAGLAEGRRRRADSSICYKLPLKMDVQSNKRFLSANEEGGYVVHYSVHDKTIPRPEVVAALQGVMNGSDNLEVEFNLSETKLRIEDLTRDDMEVTFGDTGGDLSGSFSLLNAFVIDNPDTFYTVDCPVEVEGEEQVCTVEESASDGNYLVNCHSKESVLLDQDIPEACLDKGYDVSLAVDKSVPHFFLHAVIKDDMNADWCPPNIDFEAVKGTKTRSIRYMKQLHGERFDAIKVGYATLGDILEAERKVEAPGFEVRFETETCAHYAQGILRSLSFKETQELGDFVVHHLTTDDAIANLKTSDFHFAANFHHALENNPDFFRSKVRDIVFSQLNIEL